MFKSKLNRLIVFIAFLITGILFIVLGTKTPTMASFYISLLLGYILLFNKGGHKNE